MNRAQFVGADILSMRDFDKNQILTLLEVCKEFERVQGPILQGKILGSFFFEPSTRTRLSFECAMNRLGGRTIGFAEAQSTSSSKGESLWDTIKVAESYCDIMVLRHPQEGAARLAAEASAIPVINGGDGANQHPTQTLLDLYTILRRAGRIDRLKVAMVGDLKYGRTVHSLIRSLALFQCSFWLVSPPPLSMPEDFLEDLADQGAECEEVTDLGDVDSDLDILYVTRIQRERFPDPLEYERVRNAYELTANSVERFESRLTIMHPLPRNTELDRSLDQHPGAAYFDQVKNGVLVRKAILALLLGAVSE